jgi:hypothetical protein
MRRAFSGQEIKKTYAAAVENAIYRTLKNDFV